MRALSWTRGATYALALSLCLPLALPTVAAAESKKSLAACTSFAQADKGDDTVQFTVHNTCSVPVDCSITWRLVCAPESKKRRASHAGAARLSLASNSLQTADASAATCGDDGWSIEAISWSCAPNQD